MVKKLDNGFLYGLLNLSPIRNRNRRSQPSFADCLPRCWHAGTGKLWKTTTCGNVTTTVFLRPGRLPGQNYFLGVCFFIEKHAMLFPFLLYFHLFALLYNLPQLPFGYKVLGCLMACAGWAATRTLSRSKCKIIIMQMQPERRNTKTHTQTRV